MSSPRWKNPGDNEINITQHEFSVKELDRTCFLNFCLASWEIIPITLQKLPEGLETIPEASSPNPEDFQKNLIFCNFFVILWVMQKSLLQSFFCPENRNGPTNAFPDRSWPNLGQKIAPVPNEFTDLEIFPFFAPKYPIFWHPFFNLISSASVLLLELERLYESFLDRSWPKEGRKIDPERNEHTDSEISSVLWAGWLRARVAAGKRGGCMLLQHAGAGLERGEGV